MKKLLNDDEIVYELGQLQIQAVSEQRSFKWAQDKQLNLINTQKRLYADMVIGEDELVQYADDQPATDLDDYAEARNDLRANQRKRNTL